MVVGWYHSHPGFGCWLSGVDVNTQQSFEALNPRAVAVVVDPIQSVRGKVVVDAFRCISPQTMMLGQEARQTTSNVGHLHKPSIQALIHGLNRHYYSIAIGYRKTPLEERMLLNLQKQTWAQGLEVQSFRDRAKRNATLLEGAGELATRYEATVRDERAVPVARRGVERAGKVDAKRRLEDAVEKILAENVVQCMGSMLDTVVF